MAIRVYKMNRNAICVSSNHNRVVIDERMLDNDTSLDIYAGPAGKHMKLLATLAPAPKVGDVVNGLDINPDPGMVVKNESSQLVLHYLLVEIVDDKPVYQWHIPGVTYGLTSLSDDNYKILDVGEIDD